jgi:hypothetical protein
MVLFAQLDNEVVSGRFLGLDLGSVARADKEDGTGFATEVVAQNVEGTEGVPEGAGDILGGTAFDQESAQGFVLAVFGQAWLEEEAAELT